MSDKATVPVVRKGGVTLAEMARETGLSKETISHVLNGRGPYKHSEKTREVVLAAAARLGYRPHSGARAIRQGRFNTIGLLFRHGEYWVDLPSPLITGIGETLSAQGLRLILMWMPDDKLSPDGALTQLFGEHSVDGLLISCWGGTPDILRERANALSLPAAWINADLSTDAVRPDDYGAGRMAAEHLLRLGHRRLGYVQFNWRGEAWHFSGVERRAGFLDAAARAGVSPLVVQENVEFRRRVDRAAAILSGPERPTAICTYSALSAVSLAYGAVSRCGLEVPRDLSLITFDGSVDTSLSIALSTIMHPSRAMGIAAAELLTDRMGGAGRHLKTRVVPFTEIRGESCAPPPVPGENSKARRRK